MTQEYISKLWLLQNIVADEDSEAMHLIEDAPIVEFDPDEPPRHGRCRRCRHYKGGADDPVGTCGYWPGFISGDDWCSNYVRRNADEKA